MMQSHPRDEDLIAYLAGELPTGREATIEAHLGCCDHCVGLLVGFHANLQSVISPPRAEMIAHRRWGSVSRQPGARLSSFTRPAFLAPLSFAAGVLLAAAVGTWRTPDSEVQWRSVDSTALPASGRAFRALPGVQLRRAPEPTSEVLAVLQDEPSVEVLEEDGSWSRVRIADGTEGWIETGRIP